MHLHISGGFLFTVRRAPCPELDSLHDGLVPQGAEAEEYIVYRVLDALTDAIYPVIDHFEARIDALEERVLEAPDRLQLTDIYRLKQEVQALQRRLVSQRDQFGAASEAILELPGLTRGSRVYLRDIGDHLAQVTGELYRQTDDLGALDVDVLRRQREPAQPARDAADRARHVLPHLDAGRRASSARTSAGSSDHIDSLEAFVIYETIGLVIPTIAAAIYFWRRRRDWL